MRQVSGRPIKFVGTGEKMEALEPFFPERMASRILGALPLCGGPGGGGRLHAIAIQANGADLPSAAHSVPRVRPLILCPPLVPPCTQAWATW